MKTTHTPEDKCPYCGHKISAATSVTSPHATPRPGDMTVCLECQEVSIFTVTLTLRKPTRKEQELIDRDSAVLATQMLMRAYKNEKGQT